MTKLLLYICVTATYCEPTMRGITFDTVEHCEQGAQIFIDQAARREALRRSASDPDLPLSDHMNFIIKHECRKAT